MINSSDFGVFLGLHGFLLPANQIVPNAEEVLDGLIAFVKANRVHNYL